MNYSEIPHLIEITKTVNTPTAVSIYYTLNGISRPLLIVFKTDTDPYWKAMDGRVSQLGALMAATAEEQKIFNASTENINRLNREMLKHTGTAFFSPLHN